jgi:ABC-type oligopeptide transport system substrate-binding subunit
LQVTLTEPAPFFNKLLAHPVFRPLPRQSVSRSGENGWATPEHIVTSGAFKLSAWKPKDQLVVERNSQFWDNANTRLDQITFRMARKDTLDEGVALYEDSEVDAVSRVASGKAEQLRDKKDFLISASTTTLFLVVNPGVKPLDDARVRRALSTAIDRQALTADSYGLAKPLTNFVPPLEDYEGATGAGYDPEQARRLLAEAGYTGGRGFPEIELIYNTAETNRKMAEFVQASLQKELGIKLKLNSQEWRTFLENRSQGKFNGLARAGWVPDYSDAYAYLQLLMTGGELKASWTDVKYDQMLRHANAELDPTRRATLLRQAETYMLAQQPVIPLSSSAVSFLCKPYVKNLVLNPVAQPDWRAIYIDHAVTAESPGS